MTRRSIAQGANKPRKSAALRRSTTMPATMLPAGDERAEMANAREVTPMNWQRVAEVAYFLAERRGFSPGHELDDWLQAEAEVVGARVHGVRR